jgi:hypothetical protein
MYETPCRTSPSTAMQYRVSLRHPVPVQLAELCSACTICKPVHVMSMAAYANFSGDSDAASDMFLVQHVCDNTDIWYVTDGGLPGGLPEFSATFYVVLCPTGELPHP